eukprot:TRINITY_DN29147_c0_g2_i1.p1 TRINITY_DN29147_c0_g2~~TRINITY_DN29147_c0_g2_i1.p1  ORF type:complete len:466 (+),score=104.79 TRINITY_DN29147_c0_g2_i1:181-1578(+)
MVFQASERSESSSSLASSAASADELYAGVHHVVYKAHLVHCLALDQLEILPNHYIGVRDGRITFVSESLPAFGDFSEVIDLGNKFVMPGFVDTHIHASQYMFSGTGRMPLLKWLNEYAFPTEARFADPEYAREAYKKAVRRSLAHGTTTACYFATIHKDSTLALAEVTEELGQRALIGKVSMDRHSPDFYGENTAIAIKSIEDFVTEFKSRHFKLAKPVLTPRFVPTCSSQLMERLGELAKEHDLHVQSHICETKNEIAWVSELHPDHDHYAHVYDAHGLLTDKTVMAHGVHLNDDEVELLHARGTGVSHCPNSNFAMGSGVLDVRRLLRSKVKVGLGTDVGGGYSCSVLDAIRQCLIASTSVVHLKHGNDKENNHLADPLSVDEAFYLATLGGHEVLKLDHELGNFLVGKKFDALVVDPCIEDCPFDVFPQDTLHDILNKFVFLGDDRNIVQVIVDGNVVISRS